LHNVVSAEIKHISLFHFSVVWYTSCVVYSACMCVTDMHQKLFMKPYNHSVVCEYCLTLIVMYELLLCLR
jgi:hypothetical protein